MARVDDTRLLLAQGGWCHARARQGQAIALSFFSFVSSEPARALTGGTSRRDAPLVCPEQR